MRKQTEEDLRIIYEEEDALKGNINRMCVTDNMYELMIMSHEAIRRIERISRINFSRLAEDEK